MNANRAIHQGWVTGSQPRPPKPQPMATKKGVVQYQETEPLVLHCGPEKVADEEWEYIEDWIRRSVPIPGHRLQVLISICTCRPQGGKPLELRLEHERAAFSPDQRDRVSLRQHRHDDQPVRLEITLRQIVRPA